VRTAVAENKVMLQTEQEAEERLAAIRQKRRRRARKEVHHMAIEDGRFANEPDVRMMIEAFGRCVGDQFGVSVKLASIERVGAPEQDGKKEAAS